MHRYISSAHKTKERGKYDDDEQTQSNDDDDDTIIVLSFRDLFSLRDTTIVIMILPPQHNIYYQLFYTQRQSCMHTGPFFSYIPSRNTKFSSQLCATFTKISTEGTTAKDRMG